MPDMPHPYCSGGVHVDVIDLLREGVPLRLLVDLADTTLSSEALLEEELVSGGVA
jgi:hypothetical protein